MAIFNSYVKLPEGNSLVFNQKILHILPIARKTGKGASLFGKGYASKNWEYTRSCWLFDYQCCIIKIPSILGGPLLILTPSTAPNPTIRSPKSHPKPRILLDSFWTAQVTIKYCRSPSCRARISAKSCPERGSETGSASWSIEDLDFSAMGSFEAINLYRLTIRDSICLN